MVFLTLFKVDSLLFCCFETAVRFCPALSSFALRLFPHDSPIFNRKLLRPPSTFFTLCPHPPVCFNPKLAGSADWWWRKPLVCVAVCACCSRGLPAPVQALYLFVLPWLVLP